MHNIWRGQQEGSWSPPGVSVCTKHTSLGLCSCSNVKPKEDQVCSYKSIFLRNWGDWKTPPEKRFQKQETGDQNSNDLSAILNFSIKTLSTFSLLLCALAVVNLQLLVWQKQPEEPSGSWQVGYGSVQVLTSWLASFQDVTAHQGCLSRPVLFWKVTLFLFHMSPTWLPSLYPPAPPWVNIVCVFLVPCQGYVCSSCHQPFCLW